MTAPLRIEAARARQLIQDFGLDDSEARELTIASETDLREVLAELVEADAADETAIEQCRARRAELSLRAERIEARRDRRREAIADVLATVGLKKLDAGTATVSAMMGTQAAVITDEAALPPGFIVGKTTYVPARMMIRRALLAGEDVPGATLSNARQTVVIRRT